MSLCRDEFLRINVHCLLLAIWRLLLVVEEVVGRRRCERGWRGRAKEFENYVTTLLESLYLSLNDISNVEVLL